MKTFALEFLYSFGANFSLGRIGRYHGLNCVNTLVILNTLCIFLLQASPYFSQDQNLELEKEDALSVVKHCNGSYEKVYL